VRDLNQEYQDTNKRKYAYDFDYIHRDYMLKRFESHFSPDQKVLELGCYKGEFTKKLTAIFEDITVVEGSSDLITEAKANVNSDKVTFKNSYFEEMDLDQKYDIIFLVHTLEHLTDRPAVLAKIKSLLSKQGKFIVVVPNANAPSRQIAVQMGLIDHNTAVTDGEHKHGHRITYASDTLRSEMIQADFDVVEQGGILFKPLANYQIDLALDAEIIDLKFLEGCYQLGMVYPDLCASIYAICK
jgi:2-polyprenyl-3-methyl-5-hydroxy-6-metoxy-1,4-benzoquinol methylase